MSVHSVSPRVCARVDSGKRGGGDKIGEDGHILKI